MATKTAHDKCCPVREGVAELCGICLLLKGARRDERLQIERERCARMAATAVRFLQRDPDNEVAQRVLARHSALVAEIDRGDDRRPE